MAKELSSINELTEIDAMNEKQRSAIEELAAEAMEASLAPMEKMYLAMESLFRVVLAKRDIKITVLYHSDLDGNASAFCIKTLLDAMYAYSEYLYGNKKHNMSYNFRRINYNYNIEKFEDISDSDAIFVVDYSLSVKEHIQFLTEKTIGDIYWIDHHQGSYDTIINNPNDQVAHKFMSMNRLFNIFYTKKGVSGALLCYNFLRYVWNKIITIQSGSPCSGMSYERVQSIIGLVSLYDTFHPYSSKEFYYGINMLEYDMQSGNYSTWEGLLIDYPSKVSNVYKTNGLCMGKEIMQGDFKKTLGDVFEDGKIILAYETQQSKKNVSAQMVEFTLLLAGREYKVAAINKLANSFVFGDEYEKHDGVIVFYYNKYGTYTFSFFANEYGENPLPCLELAKKLGGGGHRFAAGVTLNYNLLEKLKSSNL